jgi:hypothetical protein
MLDDGFEARLREAAREYNEPPETPREAMWTAIQSERLEARKQDRAPANKVRSLPFLRPLSWAAGIAALLGIGVGLGRLSSPARPSTPLPTVATSTGEAKVNAAAYRLATTEHLEQSEAFLTLFRASVRRGGDERVASAAARQLLATNRLLLDSPAAQNGRTKLLLQDLELVLAEIAQLSPRPTSGELELINDGLENGGMMSRLRTAVPSGTSTTQGAL